MIFLPEGVPIYNFTVSNELTEIKRLKTEIGQLGRALGFSSQTLFVIMLSLEETIHNIISYGYSDNNEHCIAIRLEVSEEEVVLEVEDDGRPFNPSAFPAPDVEKPLEQRDLGGLGIHLIRNLTDSLSYRRAGGKNILTASKKRAN